MNIEAVVTDLDGTIADEGLVDDKNRAVLDRLFDQGIPVIVSTTRMRYSASQIMSGTKVFQHPAICLNGGMIMGGDWDKPGEVWFEKSLDMKIARAITEFTDDKGYELTTIFDEKKYWRQRRADRLGKHFENPTAVIVKNNSEALDAGEPASFMIHRDGNGLQALLEIEEFVHDNFSSSVTLHRHHRDEKFLALTVYPYGINKGSALETLSKRANIDLDKVLAIGDDYVDVPMFDIVGKSVAMKNSPKEVRAKADDVAPACTERGFACCMEKYVLR